MKVKVIAISLTMFVGLSACGAPVASTQPPSSEPSSFSPSGSESATAQQSASPSPTPTPVSPLTGTPNIQTAPVLIMKLDNTKNAQPHAGLTDADIVYIEEVEYGITRLAAVFSSKIPDRIGPIRSARITDIDLVAQFGNPAFGYSGAQRKLLPDLAAGSFVNVSANKGGEGYSRDNSRRAPYNYFANGVTMLERGGKKVSDAPDMGWAFSTNVPTGGTSTDVAGLKWSYSKARFAYDPVAGTYRVGLNGSPARAEESDNGQQASTVVIQSVKQYKSRFHDKWGAYTPMEETVGTGKAVVLRDGQSYDVTWSRSDAASPTTYTLADGSVMPFKPGQTWIVLYDRARTPSLKSLATEPASISPSPQPSPSR